MYPIRHSHHGIITRRVAKQYYRGAFSPWVKTGPAGHQPSILMPQGNKRGFISQFDLEIFLNIVSHNCKDEMEPKCSSDTKRIPFPKVNAG